MLVPTFIQSADNQSTGNVSSITVTMTPTAAGSLLVGFVCTDGNVSTTISGFPAFKTLDIATANNQVTTYLGVKVATITPRC